MSGGGPPYFGMLLAAGVGALMSAFAMAASVELQSRVLAWGWLSVFVLSALASAYCFGRLL